MPMAGGVSTSPTVTQNKSKLSIGPCNQKVLYSSFYYCNLRYSKYQLSLAEIANLMVKILLLRQSSSERESLMSHYYYCISILHNGFDTM